MLPGRLLLGRHQRARPRVVEYCDNGYRPADPDLAMARRRVGQNRRRVRTRHVCISAAGRDWPDQRGCRAVLAGASCATVRSDPVGRIHFAVPQDQDRSVSARVTGHHRHRRICGHPFPDGIPQGGRKYHIRFADGNAAAMHRASCTRGRALYDFAACSRSSAYPI